MNTETPGGGGGVREGWEGCDSRDVPKARIGNPISDETGVRERIAPISLSWPDSAWFDRSRVIQFNFENYRDDLFADSELINVLCARGRVRRWAR